MNIRRSFILVLLVVGVGIAHGQGTILFQNLGPGFAAPVYNAAGELVPAGWLADGLYAAELLVGRSPDSLAPVSGTTVFVTPGFFGIGDAQRVLPGFAPGEHPWFQVRVWFPAGIAYILPGPPLLEYGASEPFQLDLQSAGLGGGFPPMPPPALFGMKSFQLVAVPEPAAIWLTGLGMTALIVLRWANQSRRPYEGCQGGRCFSYRFFLS